MIGKRKRSQTPGPLALLRGIIRQVPRGKVVTYGQVAAAAGSGRAARLTVLALQRSVDLPWHRVVGAGGRIALSGEEGREQRLRLEIEGVSFRNGRVRMELHGWIPRQLLRPALGEGVRTPRSAHRRDRS